MVSNTQTVIIVSKTESGQRLDRFLMEKPGILSRSKAAQLIALDLVRVNGKIPKSSLLLNEGMRVEYSLPEQIPSELKPLKISLDIVYEDADLIVINKPSGLVVHPAAGHAQDTLVNALLHHTDNLSAGFHEQRPGIVHRLDRDTSGLLVVAKTEAAQISLSAQFKARTINRKYLAVVYGSPRNKAGKIESFLARHPSERKRFASTTKGGKKAITNYKVLASSPSNDCSLLELKLETGRTHQIRVHLSEMGHPIVGDALYSKASRSKTLKSAEVRDAVENLSRFLLHATELGFLHPISNEDLNFKVSWPSDVLPLLKMMGYTEP